MEKVSVFITSFQTYVGLLLERAAREETDAAEEGNMVRTGLRI